MSTISCTGYGKFAVGMLAGMAVGAAVGMSVAPSNRQIKRAAHMAAKRVNAAVESFAEAMDLK